MTRLHEIRGFYKYPANKLFRVVKTFNDTQKIRDALKDPEKVANSDRFWDRWNLDKNVHLSDLSAWENFLFNWDEKSFGHSYSITY